MNPRELFSVLLKALGVWKIVDGLVDLPMLVSNLTRMGTYDNPSEFFALVFGHFMSFGLLQIIVGVVLLFSADWIARKVYPDRETSFTGN